MIVEKVGTLVERTPWFTYPQGKSHPSKDPDKALRRRKNKLARMARQRNRT